MMLEWMLRAVVVSALVGGAALALDEAFRLLRRPRRWVWFGAMVASVTVPWVMRSGLAPKLAGGIAGLGLTGEGLRGLFRGLGEGVRGLFTAVSASGTEGGVAGWGAGAEAVAEVVGGAGAPVDAGWAWALHLLDATLPWLWLAASLVMVAGFAWAAYRLRTVRARWTPAVVEGQPVLVAERAGPAVVGVLRPAAVVPRWVLGGEAEARRLIVRHEAEHLAAGDTRLLASSALLLAAMPWNPVLWWQHMRLCAAIETDCDARVLAGGVDPHSYGRILIDVAARGPAVPILALPVARKTSRLERRLRALIERPGGRRRGTRAALLGAFALLVAAVACDVAQPLRTEKVDAEVAGADVTPPGIEIPPDYEIIEVPPDLPGSATIEPPPTIATPPTIGLPPSLPGSSAEVPITVIEVPPSVPDFTIRAGRFAFEGGRSDPPIGDASRPIIYVDGKRFQGRLDGLDPAGIDRIEVIKGAAAKRIFGAGASGGVIQIFTRKGEAPNR